jgi:hypothetical protein
MGAGDADTGDMPAATSTKAITGETAVSRPLVLLDKIPPR